MEKRIGADRTLAARFTAGACYHYDMPLECEEKERLLVAYDRASSELSEAVTALRKNEGVSGKDEYEAMCRSSEDAHMRTEQARLAFERHQQDHRCR
jgi:hypothetical protein